MNAQLLELRKLPHLQTTEKVEAFPCEQIFGGIPKSRITEISGPLGSGKTSFALDLLKENTQTRSAWIEKEVTAYPEAFLQKDIYLERVLFVNVQKQALWSVYQALYSQIFDFVIFSTQHLNLPDLKRLRMATEKSPSALLLITPSPHKEAWPITLQIEAKNSELTVLKRRGG